MVDTIVNEHIQRTELVNIVSGDHLSIYNSIDMYHPNGERIRGSPPVDTALKYAKHMHKANKVYDAIAKQIQLHYIGA